MKKEKVYILWTGGWDSTFMLIHQIRQKKTVQPIYIVDKNRKSHKIEMEAMNKILDELKKEKYYGGNVLPIEFVELENIKDNDEIEKTWKKVNADTGLGIQHDWIAKYAEEKNIDICLGHEKGSSPNDHLTRTITNYTSLIQLEDGTYIIDKKKSSKEGVILLGRMRLPIMQYYETDMLDLVKKWNCMNVMSKIWFCHSPINGKPCGVCHPCDVKMESGMDFLLPEKSQKRYYRKNKIKKIFGKKMSVIYMKFVQKISK